MRTIAIAALLVVAGCATKRPPSPAPVVDQAAIEKQEQARALWASNVCRARLPDGVSEQRMQACILVELQRQRDAELNAEQARVESDFAAATAARQAAAVEDLAETQRRIQWNLVFQRPAPARPVYVTPPSQPVNCTSYQMGSYLRTSCN